MKNVVNKDIAHPVTIRRVYARVGVSACVRELSARGAALKAVSTRSRLLCTRRKVSLLSCCDCYVF